nr:MAG TPA: hypothetical protein [Caudoviricetes sp.]
MVAVRIVKRSLTYSQLYSIIEQNRPLEHNKRFILLEHRKL